jgi:hypothetical protein
MKSTDKDLNKALVERNVLGFVRAKKKTVVITPQEAGDIRKRASCIEALRTFKFDQGQLEVWKFSGGRPEGFLSESKKPVKPAALPERPSEAKKPTGAAESGVVAALISYDRDPLGEIFSLNSGWLLITSTPSEAGRFLHINDASISPSHAILSISDKGEVSVMDRFSTHGTRILSSDGTTRQVGDRMEKLLPGDRVFFGTRSFSILGSNPEV